MAKSVLTSFDGGVCEEAECQRPDRYRDLETELGTRRRIPRGGGFSYSAASFGGGSLVQDMRRFNRVLQFDPVERQIEVESGMTLDRLLEITAGAGLWLPVIPGCPGITIGGCVAANVHGKNPSRHGTFREWVKSMTLLHPAYGTRRISSETDSQVFELTCGGYGLTGIISSVLLKLVPLPGGITRVRRLTVTSLSAGLDTIRSSAADSDFAYSFHYANPSSGLFGQGYIEEGKVITGTPVGKIPARRAGAVTSANRGRIPFSVWGWPMTRCLHRLHWMMEGSRAGERDETLYHSAFPFTRNESYFFFYGRRGLIEYQLIITDEKSEGFLTDLQRLLRRERPPAIMCSLKTFKGEAGLLRFERDGVCLTLDFIRSKRALAFLTQLDELTARAGGIPNLAKDSRLPRSVVETCYPGYGQMKRRLAEYDPERLFCSELSERLEL